VWTIHPLIALALVLTVVVPALRLRWLSLSGGCAALVVGWVTLAAGGWQSALVLLTFFVSSSALSRWRAERKRRMELLTGKGSRRGAVQVLANGGVATVAVALYALSGDSRWWVAFAGAYAAANADTWGSELGALSPHPPRHLLTGRILQAGDSGGVTALGFLASGMGSGLVALVAGALGALSVAQVTAVAVGGLVGSVVDSLLGASVQARYRCDVCGEVVEHARHCGSSAQLLGGWRWLSNDVVNLCCTLAGSAVGWVWGGLRGM